METEYQFYDVKRILNIHEHSDPWFWIRYSAHPYVGCEYCYTREKKYYPYDDPVEYSRIIRIKKNTPEALRRERTKVPRDIIAVGDYQPIEAKTELSRRMLEVCLELDFPVIIIEKSNLVLRDLDLIKKINEKSWACVVFSIITTKDDEVRKHFEPKASETSRRFKAMKECSQRGSSVGVAFMHILPFVYDGAENLEAVVATTEENDGKFILAGGLTLASPQKEWYYNALRKNFPDMISLYEAIYKGNYSPPCEYYGQIGKRVSILCMKYGISDMIPRYLEKGKLAVNKSVAELLHDKAYRLELVCTPSYKVWAYRKAAWTIDDLRESIIEIYESNGLEGLLKLLGIGKSSATEIEAKLLRKGKTTKKFLSYEPRVISQKTLNRYDETS